MQGDAGRCDRSALAHRPLDEAIAHIEPRIIVPMHFATPTLRYKVGPLVDFLARRSVDAIDIWERSSAEITTNTPPRPHRSRSAPAERLAARRKNVLMADNSRRQPMSLTSG